ncbi:MAG TPA: polysaccharide biosynthesis tyrosine autokinase [Ignavibacteriaceae bacterium]|jgi:tyrosine-protein kinase Etk/Wzc
MDREIKERLLSGLNEFGEGESHTFKDYLKLIRHNWVPVVLITAACLTVAVFYASYAVDIYRSTATMKISRPQGGSVLTSPLMPEFSDWGNDRFIANEMEIMKSYTTRERVANALLDSFYKNPDKKLFANIFTDEDSKQDIRQSNSIIGLLENAVSIDQKRGLDIVEVSALSPSPTESALIANIHAEEYRLLNLEMNRNQLTLVTDFLDEQRNEKYEELNAAEETLREFQEKGGLIALDERASTLISVLAEFEAQKSATQVDLMASNKVLENLRAELEKQNPRMADYLKSLTSQTYIKAIQDEIAKLEVNRDVALSKGKGGENTVLMEEYNRKITDLRKQLDKELEVLKAGIFASSPEEVKGLTQKIIEEEVRNQSLLTSIKELEKVVDGYEARFMKLPKNTIELAKLTRNSEALEKLYLMIEQRYQEALINEQSQPGNVMIIDSARIPSSPAKPNRLLIIIVGFVLGAGLAVGFVFVKNYFDDTVKTPDDIEKKNVNVLAWVPNIEGLSLNGQSEFSFVVHRRPESIPSEAFRALRTRIQFSRIRKESLKTILVTSSAPQEGKTTIAINLAGSFAQSQKRTLLIDCDLRKPAMHKIFKADRVPGLIDHLTGNAELKDVIKKSEIPNLEFITSGTIPPNPAEMLDSKEMRMFLNDLRKSYDLIVIDSPPIIAVADSEILSSMVDGTVLIVSADTTEIELMRRSVELLMRENTQFLGAVLNNFSYKSGYGSYYKYYYYYSRPEKKV